MAKAVVKDKYFHISEATSRILMKNDMENYHPKTTLFVTTLFTRPVNKDYQELVFIKKDIIVKITR